MGSFPMRVNPTLLLFLLLALLPLIASDCDGTIELDMVCPTDTEGFTIINTGPTTVDLKGWSISDGEGRITFTETLELEIGECLNIMSQTPSDWMHLDTFVIYGEHGIVSDRFNLNDKGDEIYVMDSKGDIAYSFSYGDSPTSDPFQRIPKGHVALRNHAYGYPGETEEWILHVPGRTLYHFQRTYEDCEVIPFSFPESDGKEILAQIQDAQDVIRISMYTFDNKDVSSALKDALDRGVDVRMLIEGQPAGGIDTDEISVLTTLWKSGADIRMICSDGSYKRYQYVHSKYAVIDDDVTIITSENWTDSAFSGNRGWGACIIDEDCASYISDIFDSDFCDKGDLIPFRERYATSLPYILDRYTPIDTEFTTYTADISPVICPDYSFKSIRNLIMSAKERVYSQQLNVQFSWTEGGDNPLQWMIELGSEGIDSRLLVDVTYDSPYDTDNDDGYGLYTLYRNDPNIDVRYFQSYISGLMHNKGIIVDDRVWIGSMNWTDNSIQSNREMSVIIHSKEISDMYTKLFLEDWGIEFDGEVDLIINIPEVSYGKTVTLDASGSSVPFGSTFSWDLDDDDDVERSGTIAEWKFYKDTECTLTVMDPEGNVHTKDFQITFDGDGANIYDDEGFVLEGPVKYIPLIAIVLGIIGIRRLKDRF